MIHIGSEEVDEKERRWESCNVFSLPSLPCHSLSISVGFLDHFSHSSINSSMFFISSSGDFSPSNTLSSRIEVFDFFYYWCCIFHLLFPLSLSRYLSISSSHTFLFPPDLTFPTRKSWMKKKEKPEKCWCLGARKLFLPLVLFQTFPITCLIYFTLWFDYGVHIYILSWVIEQIHSQSNSISNLERKTNNQKFISQRESKSHVTHCLSFS